MIHEVDEGGRVVGRVVCGNTACQKVLRTYEGEENAPGPGEAGYWLLNVSEHLLFMDSYGRPLRSMPWENPFEHLDASIVISLDDRIVGYKQAPGSHWYQEDFCSDRCAVQRLKNSREWNLCLRNQGDRSVLFVAHMPERFTTTQVRVKWPARTGPENANQRSAEPGSVDEKSIHYYGKELTLKRASIARYPGEAPPMIVPVTHLNLLCPLGKLSERTGRVEPCYSAIQLVVDLAPCAVLCPGCLGLLFIDHASNASRYQDADIKGALNDETVLMGYATYPDHVAQDTLHDKITRFTDGQRVLVAMRLDDELAEMLGITKGQITTIPSSCDEEELSSMLPSPSALADYVSKLALEACQQARFWEAVALAQRTLVIEPDWAVAHFFLGSACDELGMLERAVNAYQTALHLHPRFPEAYLNLGLVYERQERWADAISQYQAALRINPDYADAHYNLGVVYGHQGRAEDEIRAYQAAVWSNPEHAMARYNLGIMHYQQGRWDEALRELRVAASLGFQPAKQFLAHIGYG